MVRILQSRDLYAMMDSGELDANAMHWAYNALDSAVTLRVWERLTETIAKQNTPHARTSYQFVRAMQGPALSMMRRGIAVNTKVRQDETERYLTLRNTAQALLDRLADAVWGPEEYIEVVKTRETYTPTGKRGQPLAPRTRIRRDEFPRVRVRGLNPNSDKQVLAFFNTALGYPVEYEIRKKPTGSERTPSANNKALRKWALARKKGPGVDVRDRSVPSVRLAAPFVSLILAIRDADKALTVLRSGLDPDGRMRCSYNVVGTENGRWCVTGDHEVLTQTGWIKLRAWAGGDIAQWDSSQRIRFLRAVAQEFSNDQPLVGVYSRRVSLLATPEHSQPYYTGKGQLLTGKIGERTTLHSVPVGGQLEGPFKPNLITRASVMMQADGCNVKSNLVRFHFSKERKITRCITLLNQLEIPHTTTNAMDGTTYIYIYNPPTWLQDAKIFGPWVLQHDPAVFCDELKHWDGTWTGTATEYTTSVEDNVEWVKTMGHLNNQFTSVFKRKMTNTNWEQSYRITLTVDTTTRFSKDMYHDVATIPDKVYCPQTETGFFLVRHNNQIIVTGNSSSKNAFGRGTNLQNIGPSMRRMFCADDGHWLVSTDLEQAESRLVAGLVWATTGDDTYWNACTSGDLHTTVARMTWPELGWTDDDKANRKIADQASAELPKFSYRDLSKRLGHGSNYRGSPFGIAQAVGIPANIVDDFQRRYFSAFPNLLRWHDEIKRQLLEHQYLDTPLGRRRWFFGRPNEDSTLREAIAFGPQSTVGELLNLIMYKVWKRSLLPPTDPNFLPIQLLLQNHDAFAFQTPTTVNLADVINSVNGEFNTTPIPFVRGDEHRDLIIPGEFVTGFNWAYADKDPDQAKWAFKDSNPDGLRKWTGADNRIRQQTARPSPSEWLNGPSRRQW